MSERAKPIATPAPPHSPLSDALVAAVPNMRAFAVSLCGDMATADDLVQETLVKAFSNLDSFEAGTNLKAWLFTILRNTYFSQNRKRSREVQDVDGHHAATLHVSPGQEPHMDLQDFVGAFSMLTADQKEALVLVGAEGFSHEEAARISGCEVGTVKSRVNRARNRLRELLEQRTERGEAPRAAGKP